MFLTRSNTGEAYTQRALGGRPTVPHSQRGPASAAAGRMAVASGAPFGISGEGLTDAERSAELVKLTTVFGVRVLATEVVEDRDLLLAANVLAQ